MPRTAIVPDSYWVTGALAAGAYPGTVDPARTPAKLERFADAGIGLFVDLTHEWDRLEPYAHFLGGAVHLPRPILDMGITPVEEMIVTLDAIDAALAEGTSVYVHCFGGIGRTGIVIGSWLVRHGATPDEAIDQIREWRQTLPIFQRYPRSPQTDEQQRYVHSWRAGA